MVNWDLRNVWHQAACEMFAERFCGWLHTLTGVCWRPYITHQGEFRNAMNQMGCGTI